MPMSEFSGAVAFPIRFRENVQDNHTQKTTAQDIYGPKSGTASNDQSKNKKKV